jgi:hypothetical protein
MNKLTDVRPQRENANAHTPQGLKALETSLQVDGWIGAITVAADGETFDGSARVEVGVGAGFEDAIIVESDGSRPVIVRRTDIPTADDPRARRLGLMANRVPELNLAWDADALDAILRDVETDNPTLASLISDLADDAGAIATLEAESAPLEDDEPRPLDVEAPDLVFASDNEWGVPSLVPHGQPEAVPMPVTRWGRGARHGAQQMPGTWHFYTDDYKFSALWDDPTVLVRSGCRAIVEPNVSTGVGMPAAVALWGTYRKRWIARWAQQYGIAVFVDLNVYADYAHLNLLGVPRGWRHYATRAADRVLEGLDADYAMAERHADGAPVVFLVVGGGTATRAHCQARGWLHIPVEQHEIEGRYADGE